MDNGREFAGRALDKRAFLNRMRIDFSRPGTPTGNAYIEAFNSRLRTECLNASWFLSMADARERIEGWRRGYNEVRPHTALGGLIPNAFVQQTYLARKVAYPVDHIWGQDHRYNSAKRKVGFTMGP
ncbi:transposase [Microvirga sp. HBU67558]|nr:transposase [Microvirga sp. HBU67558]